MSGPEHPVYSLEELGAAIRTARRSFRGISRSQLAHLVGEPPDVIRRLEEGKGVSGRVLLNVLEELGFEVVIRPGLGVKGWRPEDANLLGTRKDWLGLADSMYDRTPLEEELASYLGDADGEWLRGHVPGCRHHDGPDFVFPPTD